MQQSTSILDFIGNTPLLPLKRVHQNQSGASIWGKYEAGNPGTSLKDRIALAMVQKIEKKNLNNPPHLVVASNGNTALSLAMVCSVKGWPLTIFMSAATTKEKQLIPLQYGAKVKLVKCQHCFETVVSEAEAFCKTLSDGVMINQFDDESVVRIHQETTAQEIMQQQPDGFDIFVMGVGTGGTLMGVGSVLKQHNPSMRVIAVEPESSAVLSGEKPQMTKMQQIGLGFVPANLDTNLIDEVIMVSDEEAYQMCQILAAQEGLLLGLSSGANVAAALRVAKKLDSSQRVLTVFCDQGQRYFSLDRYFLEKR